VDEKCINTLKIQKLVDEYNFLKFFFTSAKTGQGVVKAFNTIIEQLYLRFKTLEL
jgi:hypothetical protein